MNFWFMLPTLLFAFVVTSALLFVYSMWCIYGEAATKAGKDHLSDNKYFLVSVLLLQAVCGVMSGAVMVLFKKK